MEEQAAVNRCVSGSSPDLGAMAFCPSRQRGLTVNQMRNASMVRIHQTPLLSRIEIIRKKVKALTAIKELTRN